MKTISGFIIIFLMLTGIQSVVSGQNDRASRAEIREQREYERYNRRQQREKELERMIALTNQMVKLQRFVLEADYLSDRYGNRIPVSPTINFIMIDSLAATVQFGSAFTMGYNGVGGATFDGRLTRYEYSMIGRKKNVYSIRILFMSSIGIYDIMLTVNPEGKADAYIRGNWSGQLNYHGKLVPLGLSKIYKGHPRY